MKHNKHYWEKRQGEYIPRINESIPLPDNWDEIRKAIIERDIVCQECGDKEWLGVHHIDKNRLNNGLDNLTLLCWTCHTKKHHNKVDGFWVSSWHKRGQI